jgi:hypothetical protein
MADPPASSPFSQEMLRRLRAQAQMMEQVQATWRPMLESAAQALRAQSAAMQATIEAARPMIAATMQRATETIRVIGPRFQELMRRALPPNWDLGTVRIGSIETVVAQDGIPLAWVPRKELVTQLMGAPNRSERMRIILAHQSEIITDCESCLADCTAPELEERVALAGRALAAVGGGHYETAQALAVVVAEALIMEYIVEGPTVNYKKANEIATFSDEVGLAELRRANRPGWSVSTVIPIHSSSLFGIWRFLPAPLRAAGARRLNLLVWPTAGWATS